MDHRCHRLQQVSTPKTQMEGNSVTAIPCLSLSSGGAMPVLGLGTASDPPAPPETVKRGVLWAMELGYRHFDTASHYHTEQALGEAIEEALKIGLIKSRSELFVTSKLWCNDAHGELVLPALQKTLRDLRLEYIDLYLIHWPVSSKPGVYGSRSPDMAFYAIKKEDFLPMDYKSVWAAMEECQRLGLAKAIGVSNFTCPKLAQLLPLATIPPAVNQVEVNPGWQQKKLREFCNANGVLVVAYSALGAFGTTYGTNRVLESEVLKEIARARGKTVAQVCLRWAYEQGIGVLVKSFNKERIKQNIEIIDWALREEESEKISTEIPQSRACLGKDYTSPYGPFKTLEELWDGEL